MTEPRFESNTVPGATPAGRAAATGPDIADASVGQLIGQVAQDLSTLMRQELDLAKAEVKEEVTKTAKGAGMLGGAGFAGYMVVLFASIAAWWGLANLMDQGWAALVVTAVWAILGAVLFVVGRRTFQQVNPKPERTVATVKEIPDTLKNAARS